ncbi:MAG: HDOD domain-containing protein [Deltaproteobacteria bacterium]|nr:HDOD domain-containing protein [Deltaproteobacteria bacterium]MBN2673320.1 HDOD domain-containing protein [Deltaproteobacteria bacterium]
MNTNVKKGRTADFAQGQYTINEEQLMDISGGDKNSLHVAMKVKQILDSDNYEPPILPEVALSLTQLANRPDVDFPQVERVVSKDPLVAAKIVAVANSAFYSRGQPVRSLGLAIARLGLSAVRDVAFQVVAQTTIFKVSGYAARMRELYSAAQLAGVLAREICIRLKFESEMAYLCGLLHDMGEAIILGIIAGECKKERRELYSLENLQAAIDVLHSQVGARICESWGLPKVLADAILFHHRVNEYKDEMSMATVIAVTDVLLRHVGAGVPQKKADPMSDAIFYRLNLTPNQVTELIAFAEEAVNSDEIA